MDGDWGAMDGKLAYDDDITSCHGARWQITFNRYGKCLAD